LDAALIDLENRPAIPEGEVSARFAVLILHEDLAALGVFFEPRSGDEADRLIVLLHEVAHIRERHEIHSQLYHHLFL
jgi:hypothetical protein